MSDTWRFIDTGPCSASYNMALDEAIAIAVRGDSEPPTLRVYGWTAPSVSIGCFQRAADVDVEYCIENHIPIVRRPTGGRGILHGDELTYSFSSKNEGLFSNGLLDSYRQIGLAFKSALALLGLDVSTKTERESGRNLTRSALCFHSTSYGELTLLNRKIIGSAQKRWKDGLLQQGSVPYSINEESSRRIFNLDADVDVNDRMIGLRKAVPHLDPVMLKEAIRLSFEKVFRIRFRCSHLSPEEALLAQELEARRYRSAEWNFQR